MMKGPNSRKTPTRKGRTQPSKATSSKRIPPSIDETAPLQEVAPLSREKPSDQRDLWTQLVPIFNEYQKYCIDRSVNGMLDEQSEVDEASSRTAFSEMMQFRSGLLQKLLTAVHMNDVTSELNLVTISKDVKDQSSSMAGSGSDHLAMVCRCFTQAMDCAVASLLTQDFTTSSKSTSSTGSASSSASGSVACLSIFELIAWVSVQLVNLQNHDITPPKLRDAFYSLCNGSYEKVCLPVLSHICKFAECSVDAIRIVAVRALCSMAECLESCSSMDPPVQDWLNVLDAIQQALLPRFTDKAVSVRCAVVQACFPSGFCRTTPDNPLRTDPDILQALQWIVQHDPSPNNRIVAVQNAPFDRTTMEYIIPRIRDTKVGVRTAVIGAVSNAMLQSNLSEPTDFLLPSRHIAEIVTSGYTDRCLVTKDATRRMICTSLIKAFHFNPISLLEWVNVLDNTAIASSILEIWIEAAKTSPSFVHDFSNSDLQSFQHGLHDSIAQFSIANIDVSEKSAVNDLVGRLFVARNLLKFTESTHEKEAIWSQLVPDISVLCQVLETVVSQLVQVFATKANNEDEESCHEDKITFICQELLLLATINTSASRSQLEEGSRRVLVATIKNLLSNVVTPDDLLEGCVSALKGLCSSTDCDQFNVLMTQMLPVVEQLAEISESTDNELLSIHTSIRIQTLITLVLEMQECSESLPADLVPNLMKYIRPAASQSNVLLRQAAVRTMGLLASAIVGSFENLQDDEFTSTLLSLSTSADEGLEIRIQAMFALTDWCMLRCRDQSFFTEEHSLFISLCEQIDADFNAPNPSSSGTVCCVAEMATKLIVFFMLNGPPADSFFHEKCRSWLARLVMLYFDSSRLGQEDENGDIHHIGSPVRLQQFLSSFFSAMTSTHPLLRSSQFLLDAIAPLLSILLEQQIRRTEGSGKAKVSAGNVLLWTRSIDFIASTVVSCRAALAELPAKTQPSLNVADALPVRTDVSTTSSAEESSVSNVEVAASSPYLGASLQVVRFLSHECTKINVAIRRGLCKSVASMMLSVDISTESWDDLFCLKELLEELVENDGIDDGPCRRTLSPVLQSLVDVESDQCEENEDDEDVASLSDALGKIDMDPEGAENILPSVSGKDSNKILDGPQAMLRRTRRLRTSN